jgi:FixJ family two-component response regulator
MFDMMRTRPTIDKLTAGKLELLNLIVEGENNAQIAQTLGDHRHSHYYCRVDTQDQSCRWVTLAAPG